MRQLATRSPGSQNTRLWHRCQLRRNRKVFSGVFAGPRVCSELPRRDYVRRGLGSNHMRSPDLRSLFLYLQRPANDPMLVLSRGVEWELRMRIEICQTTNAINDLYGSMTTTLGKRISLRRLGK